MSVNGEFFRFHGGELTPVLHALSETLAVADSFLITEGEAIGLDRHFQRFAQSVAEHENLDLEEFFSAAIRLIPPVGDWFPRLEYRANQPASERLYVRVRPAPERTETLTLWTLNEPDRREKPLIKGPDLSLCQKYRRAANLHGADEAVLLDSEGYIADGALSSLVWIRDNNLFAPDQSTNWLPSITRELVFQLANQAGMQIRESRAKPEDLEGCEVWSLSSLQGIRGVTAWAGLDIASPRLYVPFRKRLGLLKKSVKR